MRRVELLGGLQIHDSKGSYRLAGETVQNLLAYLLLHPRHPIHREMLADLLFPDLPRERGRRNLSAAIYRLQTTLGYGWLKAERDFVALDADAGMWVDVWEFERLAASSQVSDLQKSVDLYER